MRSIESSFQFVSFKIDNFKFNLADDLSLLVSKGEIQSNKWKFKIGFLQPQFFVDEALYISGLTIDMRIPEDAEQNANSKEDLVSLHAEISGVFRCEAGKMPVELEQKLVKNQIPAILMPYLRSAITGFLSSAGFGSIVLPLINMNVLAEQGMKDVKIHEVRD